jgi:hypothetical protein
MKFLSTFSFDILNKPQFGGEEQKRQNTSDEAQIDAYGVGAAMPADILGFSFAADNRNNIHIA